MSNNLAKNEVLLKSFIDNLTFFETTYDKNSNTLTSSNFKITLPKANSYNRKVNTTTYTFK